MGLTTALEYHLKLLNSKVPMRQPRSTEVLRQIKETKTKKRKIINHTFQMQTADQAIGISWPSVPLYPVRVRKRPVWSSLHSVMSKRPEEKANVQSFALRTFWSTQGLLPTQFLRALREVLHRRGPRTAQSLQQHISPVPVSKALRGCFLFKACIS